MEITSKMNKIKVTVLDSELVVKEERIERTLKTLLNSQPKEDIKSFVSLSQIIDEKLMRYFSLISNYNAKIINLSSRFVYSNFCTDKLCNETLGETNRKLEAANLKDSLESLIKEDSLTLTELTSNLLDHYKNFDRFGFSCCFYKNLMSSTNGLMKDKDVSLIFKKNSDEIKEYLLSGVEPNLSKSLRKLRGKLTWEDFGGYASVVSKLKEFSFFINHFDEISTYTSPYKLVPSGILFYGPPGTGKTFLSGIFCAVNNLPCESISASDIASTYSMGLTINLADKVEEVLLLKKTNRSRFSALYIDEIDSVIQKRGSTNSVERESLVNVLNSYLDGPKHEEGLIIIASTNKLDMIDSSLVRPGRFKVLEFKKPSKAELVEIFKSQINRRSRESKRLFYTRKFINKIQGFVDSYSNESWTGAFVSELLNSLEKRVLIKVVKNKNLPYTANYSDLLTSLRILEEDYVTQVV